ncbi:MAG: gluconate 2-dehydrogenase subunit 3 family protein [Flavobacteriia bacterium]|jgi:hypothetical protein
MKRRNFISKSLLALTGLGLVYYGNNYFSVNSKPNYNELEGELPLIDELSEIIIPKTETPGAKDAKVGIFILHYLHNCEYNITNNFIIGLKQLKERAQNQYQSNFLNLSQNKQKALLLELKRLESRIPYYDQIHTKLFGKDFFHVLKELTCIGYCTSSIALTNSLRYDRNPGTFISQIHISKHEKSWATK